MRMKIGGFPGINKTLSKPFSSCGVQGASGRSPMCRRVRYKACRRATLRTAIWMAHTRCKMYVKSIFICTEQSVTDRQNEDKTHSQGLSRDLGTTWLSRRALHRKRGMVGRERAQRRAGDGEDDEGKMGVVSKEGTPATQAAGRSDLASRGGLAVPQLSGGSAKRCSSLSQHPPPAAAPNGSSGHIRPHCTSSCLSRRIIAHNSPANWGFGSCPRYVRISSKSACVIEPCARSELQPAWSATGCGW